VIEKEAVNINNQYQYEEAEIISAVKMAEANENNEISLKK